MANELTAFQQIGAALKGRQEKIEQLLPDFMRGQGERLIARALQYWARGDWKLQQCTVASFVGCVLNAAELGFAIDGRICYAVPFNTKAKKKSKSEPDRWEHIAQMIPSYIGLMAVAKRTGLIQDCWARIVLCSDVIEFEERDGAVSYRYVPNLDVPRDRSEEVRGVLSVASHHDGWRRADWMPAADVWSIRARSKAAESGPWVTDPGEMVKKTGLRRLLKTFSDDPGLLRALELDDRAETTAAEVIEEKQQAKARSIVPAILAPKPDENAIPPWDAMPEPAAEPEEVLAAESAPEPEVAHQPFTPPDMNGAADTQAIPTLDHIVSQYKAAIEACDGLRAANKLVTLAGNDPFLKTPPTPAETVVYVAQLLQGNVAKWKQKKAQGGLHHD